MTLKHMYFCVCVCVHLCVRACMRVCMCVCACVAPAKKFNVHVCIQTYIHTHTHTCTHTHTHCTHIHTHNKHVHIQYVLMHRGNRGICLHTQAKDLKHLTLLCGCTLSTKQPLLKIMYVLVVEMISTLLSVYTHMKGNNATPTHVLYCSVLYSTVLYSTVQYLYIRSKVRTH